MVNHAGKWYPDPRDVANSLEPFAIVECLAESSTWFINFVINREG
jgi:hypothetical protein